MPESWQTRPLPRACLRRRGASCAAARADSLRSSCRRRSSGGGLSGGGGGGRGGVRVADRRECRRAGDVDAAEKRRSRRHVRATRCPGGVPCNEKQGLDCGSKGLVRRLVLSARRRETLRAAVAICLAYAYSRLCLAMWRAAAPDDLGERGGPAGLRRLACRTSVHVTREKKGAGAISAGLERPTVIHLLKWRRRALRITWKGAAPISLAGHQELPLRLRLPSACALACCGSASGGWAVMRCRHLTAKCTT